MLVLEIKFERALYLYDEGYDTDANYDLPQPLNKFNHIYAVPSAAEASFNPMGYQGSTIPTLCLPQKEGQQNSSFIKCSADI